MHGGGARSHWLSTEGKKRTEEKKITNRDVAVIRAPAVITIIIITAGPQDHYNM
jgi:hypothetical protein